MKPLEIKSVDLKDDMIIINNEFFISFKEDENKDLIMDIDYNSTEYSDSQIQQMGNDMLKFLEEFIKESSGTNDTSISQS